MAITRGPNVFGALYGAHQTSNPDLMSVIFTLYLLHLVSSSSSQMLGFVVGVPSKLNVRPFSHLSCLSLQDVLTIDTQACCGNSVFRRGGEVLQRIRQVSPDTAHSSDLIHNGWGGRGLTPTLRCYIHIIKIEIHIETPDGPVTNNIR